MKKNKSLLLRFAEWWENSPFRDHRPLSQSKLLPSLGNVLFTLIVAGLLVMTQRAWANPLQKSLAAVGSNATTINYQGRLADASGNPQDGQFGMRFTIWDAASGGSIVWGPEVHDVVPVSDGLFNVGLGSQTAGGIPTTVWNGDRFLEIAVEGETLSPRELIRSVPIAGMALTVPDGTITSEKIAPTVFEAYLPSEISVVGNASEILSLDVDFPVAATYMIIVRTNSAYTGDDSLNSRISSYLQDELGNQIPGSSISTHHSVNGYAGSHTGSTTTFYNLEAGTHTFSLFAGASGTGGAGIVRSAHIFAVPFHQATQP